jgi:hypothetical protein
MFEVREGVAVGGGRGVFAAVDLIPGQLILSEKPIVTVPAAKSETVGVPDICSRGIRGLGKRGCASQLQETLHLALARAALAHPRRQEVLSSIRAVLHPRHLSDLEPHVLEAVRAQHAADVTALQEQVKVE